MRLLINKRIDESAGNETKKPADRQWAANGGNEFRGR